MCTYLALKYIVSNFIKMYFSVKSIAVHFFFIPIEIQMVSVLNTTSTAKNIKLDNI